MISGGSWEKAVAARRVETGAPGCTHTAGARRAASYRFNGCQRTDVCLAGRISRPEVTAAPPEPRAGSPTAPLLPRDSASHCHAPGHSRLSFLRPLTRFCACPGRCSEAFPLCFNCGGVAVAGEVSAAACEPGYRPLLMARVARCAVCTENHAAASTSPAGRLVGDAVSECVPAAETVPGAAPAGAPAVTARAAAAKQRPPTPS